MYTYWLIPSIVIIIFSVAIVVLFFQLAKYKTWSRKSISELYKLKTDYTSRQKISDLIQSLFQSSGTIVHKNPSLIIAEQFKKHFELGKYLVFCSDRNMLLPLLGIGFKLNSLNAIKIEQLDEILTVPEKSSKAAKRSCIIAASGINQIIAIAGIPDDVKNVFAYYYSYDGRKLLFIGEDKRGELSGCCSFDSFNKAAWPLIYDVCHNNNNVRRYQDKLRSLQGELRAAQNEIDNIAQKLKHKSFDIHSFYKISNDLFSIYDEKLLLEAFADSVKKILNPARIAILSSLESRTVYKVIATAGDGSAKAATLELPADSELFSVITSKKQPLILPILSSGLPNENPFLEKVLSLGFSTLEKIAVGGEIKALILLSDKNNNSPYDEAELEIFSTLANMASLAMNNIVQYSLIEKMSYTDYLTELYNYRYFYKRLREEIYRAKRFDRMLALVIFDIDNFKVFNDTYGHQVGDEVLKKLAKLVTKSVRAIDVVSRYGGEEFCVIMPDTGFANCLIFIERLRKMIEEHKFASKIVDNGYNITVSIGGAVSPVDAQSPERLIYCADMALLKAKSDGRNRSMMFNSLMLNDENLIRSSEQQLTDLGIYEDL